MVDFYQLMGDTSIAETIRNRKSVRTYSKRPVEADTSDTIRQVLRELSGPFQGRFRCELIDKAEVAMSNGVKLGTYGVILGAPLFVAAAVKISSGQAMEQLGYVFEQLVLFLTSQGLGTCWLAGTFRRSAFVTAMDLQSDEILPVVTPVGYPSRIRGPLDILIKPIPGLRRRLPWPSLFFDGDFGRPLDKTAAGSFVVPLEMVRIAPSASNKQPWRIIKREDSFLFFLEHDPAYGRRYEFEVQKIDMGIAMFHFESVAREMGLSGRWEAPSLDPVKSAKPFEHIMTWVSE